MKLKEKTTAKPWYKYEGKMREGVRVESVYYLLQDLQTRLLAEQSYKLAGCVGLACYEIKKEFGDIEKPFNPLLEIKE